MIGSTESTACPINSTVTVCAEQGIFSPLLNSNSRQSDRKRIMRLLEFFDFVEELVRLFEVPVDARVANVGHLVQRAQFSHHPLPDFPITHLAVCAVDEVVQNLLGQ